MQMAKDDKDRRTGKAGASSIEATFVSIASAALLME